MRKPSKSLTGRAGLGMLILALCMGGGAAHAAAYKFHLPSKGEDPGKAETVVGCIRSHTVAPKETLLDIARLYGLGFTDIQILHPHVDAWLPRPGLSLSIPTHWIIPESKYQGLVINVAEMRLYQFFPQIEMVKTYPIGIGDQGWETPEGVYRVATRQADPTWVIPRSLREKYGRTSIPPGPENPLGDYWLGLSRQGYGIHGTNFPWGVGRLVSHGCIRLYPEHISRLFEEVTVGTRVEIVYEPVKVGFSRGEIFLEVHTDPYGRIPDMVKHGTNRLQKLGLLDYTSLKEVKRVLQERKGVPVPVGVMRKGGDSSVAWDAVVRGRRTN